MINKRRFRAFLISKIIPFAAAGSLIFGSVAALADDTGILTGTPAPEETVIPGDPGMNDPGNNDPGTDVPGGNLGTDDSGSDTPGTDNPGTNDPGTNEPGNNTPGTDDPGNNAPGTDDPGNNTPGTDDPGNNASGTDDPGNNTPGTDGPGNNAPGTGDPGTNDPGTGDPGNNDLSTGDPGTNTPGTSDPGNNTPGTGDPGTNTPGTNDSSGETPAPQTPAPEDGESTDPAGEDSDENKTAADPTADPTQTPELTGEAKDPLDEDKEDEDKKEDEEKKERTFDLAALTSSPLYGISTEVLKVCSFCRGRDLGGAQTAVILACLTADGGSLSASANDGSGILKSVGLAGKAYTRWCAKNGYTPEDLRNQLDYFYTKVFRSVGRPGVRNRSAETFRSTGSLTTAASALFAAAAERGIDLPYTKEDIANRIVPAAGDYLALLTSGAEKREGTAGVAYYCQGEYDHVPYDTGSVMDSGCGVTAFSMAAAELTGLDLSPEVVATWGYENGADTVTNWGAFWWLADRFGIRYLGQFSGDYDRAIAALEEGNLVIVSLLQDGFFTTSDAGHYILLTGIADDGRICVNDPASLERSLQGPFDYSQVFGHCLQFWVFGN